MRRLPLSGLLAAATAAVGLISAACNDADVPGGSGGSSTSPASGTGGGAAANTTTATDRFSFFVVSYAAIKDLSGDENGFGGDLRYGQADGLAGADKICTDAAERGMANNGKVWRAFLSTTTANAIDRVGGGPWYDRRGRLFAMTKADLLHNRPLGADTTIVNDFPNENGVTNHAPEGSRVDNHDMITGSNTEGMLYAATATCSDWTSTDFDNTKKPRVGHSWPRSGLIPPPGGSSANVEGLGHWISALDESGCGPGVKIDPMQDGPPSSDGAIGSGGGYGGFYCFALTP